MSEILKTLINLYYVSLSCLFHVKFAGLDTFEDFVNSPNKSVMPVVCQ